MRARQTSVVAACRLACATVAASCMTAGATGADLAVAPGTARSEAPATSAAAAAPALSTQDAATRQRFLDGYKRTVADAGAYLKLSPAQMQRLYELLADRQLAYQQASIREPIPGLYDLSFVPGIYRESIEHEFGAAVADRWARYEGMRSGLGFVDRMLNRFYDADAPLTSDQRWKLATSYQKNMLAVTQETAAAVTDGGSLPGGTAAMERRLAAAERRVAATLAETRAFLSPAQSAILSEQLNAGLAVQRETVRLMRTTADAAR